MRKKRPWTSLRRRLPAHAAIVSSGHRIPQHMETNAYGCCRQALTRFTPIHCAGDDLQHHFPRQIPSDSRLGEEFRPAMADCRLQGTAGSPRTTAKSLSAFAPASGMRPAKADENRLIRPRLLRCPRQTSPAAKPLPKPCRPPHCIIRHITHGVKGKTTPSVNRLIAIKKDSPDEVPDHFPDWFVRSLHDCLGRGAFPVRHPLHTRRAWAFFAASGETLSSSFSTSSPPRLPRRTLRVRFFIHHFPPQRRQVRGSKTISIEYISRRPRSMQPHSSHFPGVATSA